MTAPTPPLTLVTPPSGTVDTDGTALHEDSGRLHT